MVAPDLKLVRQHRQCGVRDLPNRPQRMRRPDPSLQVYVAEKTTANLIVAAHRHPHPLLQGIKGREIGKHFFNSLLVW